ncbi:MAG: hypothetical protein ACTSXG_03995, partial [Alphaproteobacteria bacterium]
MKKIILLMVVFITACTRVESNSFTYKGKPINPFCLPWYHGETGEYNPQNIEEGLEKLEEYKNNKDYRVEEEYDEKEKIYTVKIMRKSEEDDEYWMRQECSCQYLKQIGSEHLIERHDWDGGTLYGSSICFVTLDGENIYPGEYVLGKSSGGRSNYCIKSNPYGDPINCVFSCIENDIIHYEQLNTDWSVAEYLGINTDGLYDGIVGWKEECTGESLLFEYDLRAKKRTFKGIKIDDLNRHEKTYTFNKGAIVGVENYGAGQYVPEKIEEINKENKIRETFNKVYIKYAKKCAVKGKDYALILGKDLENFKKDLHKA